MNLKRKIQDLIHDLQHFPAAEHAVRELKILDHRLAAASQLSTYHIDGNSITCHRCGKTSYHPDDVKHRYCGYCHIFHEKPWINDI